MSGVPSTDGDGDDERGALLPLFRPSPLDSISVYDIVLDIHELFVLRVDTSLKYDQLRSPQVHSFLIRPLVQECREIVNPAMLYALLANMHQFNKESASDVLMTGVMATRAMICEIVAIKLLKEFSDHEELMNALTYDFFPLANGETAQRTTIIPRWQRISALEIAIQAEAKRFLAHPAVVKILEEIWHGSIMFQSSIHKLHRVKFANEEEVLAAGYGRRGPGVMYKYEEASLLKLSRLRVPRYRHALNLFSFSILLMLYMLVLSRQRMEVTATEIVFGLWSLGFVLDEIVGFTDVGFTLYVMSLWNLFDLIILMLLLAYGGTRTAAIRFQHSDPHLSKRLLKTAYDILATIAIFLFPRLFSVLDNYESFSRMVIAVRRMTIDLAVSWVVIIVFSCGFWVAFTLAFGRDLYTPSQVAFDLMKILFGFTPTVWENWKLYSPIGRVILMFYLFITHFVIMIILIAVLSNSFSAIDLNAHEEHQFLFAVNTISMIKSESSSLFSYAPPLNLVEWAIRPLFYVLPLRQFLVLNRTIVKATHFPFLFTIFAYEKFYVRLAHVRSKLAADGEANRRRLREDRVAQLGGSRANRNGNSSSRNGGGGARPPLSRTNTQKERERVAAAQRSRAKSKISNYDLLDEVFRRPYKGTIRVRPQESVQSGLGKDRSGSGNFDTISDPDERVRTLYASVFEDDEGFSSDARRPSGQHATVRRRAVLNPSLTPKLGASYIDHGKLANVGDYGTLGRKSRLFSTTSSMLRHGAATLALSPTRSTSSLMRGVPYRRRVPDNLSFIDDGDEPSDEEGEDDYAQSLDGLGIAANEDTTPPSELSSLQRAVEALTAKIDHMEELMRTDRR